MSNDERWEPGSAWSSDDANFAAETTADEARAHYEPIVAELRERVETLQQKLSESIAREEQLESTAESWRRVSEQLQNEKRELDALASRLAADLKGEHESRRTALVHKSLHDQVVAELRERIAELEALEQVCLSWGGSIQALAEDILNTTAVGKRMKEQLDG